MMDAIQQIIGWMPALIQSTGTTLALSVLSVAAALVFSVFLALGKISRNAVISGVCRAYIFFFRGTPLLMQLFFIYYTLPQLVPALNIQSRFFAAWLAFTLNVAAYLAEIIRAAIESIDKGQMEASRALGMPWWKTMRKVILPQAFRRILPPLGNNAIAIVKDSSLASAIGLADLAYAARTVSGAYATYWEPYLTISLVYWVITFLLAQLVNRLEKRFGKSDSHS